MGEVSNGWHTFIAPANGECEGCTTPIREGEPVIWDADDITGKLYWFHPDCWERLIAAHTISAAVHTLLE